MTNLLLNSHIALWAFDFDGNILAPDTITYVIERETGEEVGIPAHTLDQNPELISWPQAKYRWKDNFIDSLVHFRDYHSDRRNRWPDWLKDDIIEALGRNAISPSLRSLKEIFLIPARICAIITARGHSPDNIARVLWIISEHILGREEKQLQETHIREIYERLYAGNNRKATRDELLRFYFMHIVSYYPVSNEHTAKYLSMSHEQSMAKRKTIAMEHFIQDAVERILTPLQLEKTSLSIGFSDDSLSNVMAMVEYFEMKRKNWYSKENKIHIYFTWKKESLKLIETPLRKIKTWEDMITIEL